MSFRGETHSSNSAGSVGIGTNNPVSPLHVAGVVTATAFNTSSDRQLKENFRFVKPLEVLNELTALPLLRWNFIGDPGNPHLGPMAQDFYAAFGLGSDDKHISTVDADGVALAAIQGFNQKLDDQTELIKAKAARIADLEQRLSRLELLLARPDIQDEHR